VRTHGVKQSFDKGRWHWDLSAYSRGPRLHKPPTHLSSRLKHTHHTLSHE